MGGGGWGMGTQATQPVRMGVLKTWQMCASPHSFSPDYAERTGTTQPTWMLSLATEQLADCCEATASQVTHRLAYVPASLLFSPRSCCPQ